MKNIGRLCVIVVAISMLQLTPLSLTPQTVHAAKCTKEVSLLGIPPWYSNLCKEGTNDVTVEDPGAAAIIILLNIIGIAVRLAGYGAVGFVIWGGIQYIIANGDSGKLSSAKKTIQNALIGLLIALSAIAIVTFIGSSYT
jgi:hypothetical protein